MRARERTKSNFATDNDTNFFHITHHSGGYAKLAREKSQQSNRKENQFPRFILISKTNSYKFTSYLFLIFFFTM